MMKILAHYAVYYLPQKLKNKTPSPLPLSLKSEGEGEDKDARANAPVPHDCKYNMEIAPLS
jgi:hypothetical protein